MHRPRKIFPDYYYEEIDKDSRKASKLFDPRTILIEITTVVRFKYNKVWYETECMQSHMIDVGQLRYKERITRDLISNLIRDAYHMQQVGMPVPGTHPSKLQISEKERLNLKHLLKYNNLNDLL